MDFYSQPLFKDKTIKNPLTYKGRGRPRKSDYINAIQAQKILNQTLNTYIDQRRKSTVRVES